MKILTLLAVATTLFVTGCASTVTTYDSTGTMIGSCKAERGFVVGGGASCTGHANQEGRTK